MRPLIEACPLDWSERPYIVFLYEVDRLLYDQYGITADDLSAVAAAQEAGNTPQDHVNWIAEHYDLEPLPNGGSDE